jgi:hypothetical protein
VVERLTQGGGDSLQHQLSDKTGFPEAIASLQPGAPAPSVTRPSGDMVPTHGLTADGNTVDLVDRDWTGLVLVPLDAQINKAHTSAVRLVAIEAHPLKDGCVRVWLRVRNVDKEELPAEVACTFRLRGAPEPGSPRFYRLQVPGGATRDVFFVSPPGDLTVYTPLVRTAVAAP